MEKAIKEYVAQNPGNRHQAFGGDHIFDEPLVGFADGDDAIFQDYKAIIGDFHFTPREALEKHLKSKKCKEEHPANVSVISFVLPATHKTRVSNRRETAIASARWNHTRWHGQDFINELSHYVVSLLEGLGHQAVAPELADFFSWKDFPNGLASNWSQRHIAYAAGLGTFSLNDGLITPRGIAMRCGSVVTDVKLPPSPRTYENYRANCLFYWDGSCRSCIERCPASAISEQGHDKNKCQEFLFTKQKEILKELGREEGYIGRYLGCGLCQTKVPCEARIPPKTKNENRR
ncbi:MAG: epoxyqueuosine reductase [Chloroflexi bacterium]|nr:epoxyqueuosine reductase [Chloroflexota bacterium]